MYDLRKLIPGSTGMPVYMAGEISARDCCNVFSHHLFYLGLWRKDGVICFQMPFALACRDYVVTTLGTNLLEDKRIMSVKWAYVAELKQVTTVTYTE